MQSKLWRLNGCKHCGGDLYLDDIGNHRFGEEWVCILCNRSKTKDRKFEAKEEIQRKLAYTTCEGATI